ncbi:MAG: hypothetical protein HY291_04625 [Planctomycetes bacterium]|nr:hypothetical protein [Planctomycetota bacterium]
MSEPNAAPAKPARSPAMRKRLGNLAEEQHKRHLRTAKGVIMFVALLSLGLNVYNWHALDEAEADFERQIAIVRNNPAMTVDEAKVKEVRANISSARTQTEFYLGVSVALLGLFFYVNANPFVATSAAFGIYLLASVIGLICNPIGNVLGLAVKAVIVAALFKGVQSGMELKKLRENAAKEDAPA